MGKKDICARILGQTAFRLGVRCPPRGKLLIVNYHRVRPDDRAWSTPFDDGVFDIAEGQLKIHLRWLARNTRVLRERELLDILSTRRFPKEPCSLITFDDGYADNYHAALPLLESEKLSALFFIPTGLTTSRRLGWWDVIAYLIKRTSKPFLQWNGETIPLECKAAAIRRVQRLMKDRPNRETGGLVLELAAQAETELPGTDLQAAELMTWDQIRDLSARGMDVGSHTHSHWVLSTLPLDQQCEEIRRSKEILERELGTAISSLAYPVGGPASFTRATMDAARSVGIRLAFSYAAATNAWETLEPYDIRRLLTPPLLPRLAAATVFPSVFAS